MEKKLEDVVKEIEELEELDVEEDLEEDKPNLWNKFIEMPTDKRLRVILFIWTFINFVIYIVSDHSPFSRSSSFDDDFYPFCKYCADDLLGVYDYSEFLVYAGGAWFVYFIYWYINKNVTSE